MTMGQKIATCRKLKNLTQDQLGDLLGVSRQAISRWESDLAYPETETLIKMSNLFDCTLDYLLKDNVEEVRKSPMTFEQHPTVGDLVVRHWRKIYIPLYISGVVSIIIGLITFFFINGFYETTTNRR